MEHSIPYKQDGNLLNYGFDTDKFSGLLRNLHVWWDRRYAAIGSHSNTTEGRVALTSYGSAPDIVGGLDWTANKSPSSWVPRTFVGVRDKNGDNNRETLLVYATKLATQSVARDELLKFQAQEIIMLDGGSSTGLIIGGSTKITSANLPNVIVIYAGL